MAQKTDYKFEDKSPLAEMGYWIEKYCPRFEEFKAEMGFWMQPETMPGTCTEREFLDGKFFKKYRQVVAKHKPKRVKPLPPEPPPPPPPEPEPEPHKPNDVLADELLTKRRVFAVALSLETLNDLANFGQLFDPPMKTTRVIRFIIENRWRGWYRGRTEWKAGEMEEGKLKKEGVKMFVPPDDNKDGESKGEEK